MAHEVTTTEVDALPTAVIPATTTWRQFPVVWPELLGEVWSCLRAGASTMGART